MECSNYSSILPFKKQMKLFVRENVRTQEDIETFREHPSSLVLDDPVFHLPESVLLVRVQQGHNGANEIFKISCLL